MILPLLLALQAAVSPLPIGGSTGDVGRCGWEHAPPGVQAAYLEGYAHGMNAGAVVLEARDAELKTALDACLPAAARNAPNLLRSSLIGSAAIRAGAAAELAKAGGPARDALDRIWDSAPEVARTCARANAGRMFGLTLACPDKASPLAFTGAAGMDIRKDLARGAQVLFYMNATAQTEWELGRLKAYEADCTGPSGCPKPK